MNSNLPQRRWKGREGRRGLPIGNAVIEEFEVAFPEIADYLLGTSAGGVLKVGLGWVGTNLATGEAAYGNYHSVSYVGRSRLRALYQLMRP